MNIDSGPSAAMRLQHFTPAAPALTFDREPWMDEASCAQVDSELFFPTNGQGRHARRICAGCPVRVECLTYALDNNEAHGIWGGLGETDREQIRANRRKAAS